MKSDIMKLARIKSRRWKKVDVLAREFDKQEEGDKCEEEFFDGGGDR